MFTSNPLTNTKILIVDDELDIIEFLKYNIKNEGYTVITATNGEEAIKMAKIEKPNLILLDIMMPGIDGISTCREIRYIESLKNTIIIFLSARTEEFSQLAGFDAGADDFISKPIKPKILISKIKALLRLGRKVSLNEKIEINGLIINRTTYKVTWNNMSVILPKKEFELLSLLASNPEKVFKREEILERVWGNEVIVGGRTIDVHIRKLREKFGDKKIQTLKGIGYKFNI